MHALRSAGMLAPFFKLHQITSRGASLPSQYCSRSPAIIAALRGDRQAGPGTAYFAVAAALLIRSLRSQERDSMHITASSAHFMGARSPGEGGLNHGL
jgi:hypothetical protein